MIQISGVLSPVECSSIRDALADEALWREGKDTAAGVAKSVKANRQADPRDRAVKGALVKIEQSLRSNQVFKAAAQPDRFARIVINRFEEGMAYGDHVDAAYIEGQRADLAFTLFLDDASAYEGGDLVITSAEGDAHVKLNAGDLVLYPATTIHRVSMVTSGVRLCAAGWVRSRVPDAQARSIIFDLEQVLAGLGDHEVRLALINIRNNLLRRFGD